MSSYLQNSEAISGDRLLPTSAYFQRFKDLFHGNRQLSI